MEVENMIITSKKEEEDDVSLPGFRFHPTDEELVGFYLKRKVEKRPISIELIKQADIYKYDPWDLPKSSNVGDKEWYFFCKRGRKYRNSIRPNRVTGSGFWKATGIDRPIYSEGRECIGLKKSLVYYRGSAGKGTKTDWMMHEFRLPAAHDKSTKHMDAKTIAQEAEVWTLCRILKRSISYNKKCIPDWREMAAKKTAVDPTVDTSSKTSSSIESSDQDMPSSYISFTSAPALVTHNDKKPYYPGHAATPINNPNQGLFGPFGPQALVSAASSFSSSMPGADINELLRNADWEDLRSIVDCAAFATNYNPFSL